MLKEGFPDFLADDEYFAPQFKERRVKNMSKHSNKKVHYWEYKLPLNPDKSADLISDSKNFIQDASRNSATP